MRMVMTRVLTAIVALVMSQGIFAAHPPWNTFVPEWAWPPDFPYPPAYHVWLDCDPADTLGNPPLEPFTGKSKVQKIDVGLGDVCYRLEFKCDSKMLLGGFMIGIDVFGGAVGILGGWIAPVDQLPEPDDVFCDTGGFFHKGNREFRHTCVFDQGHVELKGKAAGEQPCSDLPDPIFPDP